MARSSVVGTIFSVLASICIIIVSILTITSIFYPEWFTNTTKEAINFSQYRTETGEVRPGIVSAQINIFIYAILIFAILAGLTLVGAYYVSTSIDSSSVAVGGKNKKRLRWGAMAFVGVLCIFLGATLPRAIFNPTDTYTLSRDFGLAAMALRSNLGGIAVGFIIFLLSLLFAFVFFAVLIKLPWRHRRNKMQSAFA